VALVLAFPGLTHLIDQQQLASAPAPELSAEESRQLFERQRELQQKE
jgi:hypothetical protein